jgi:RNA recognition motif-containing protein
MRQLYIANLGFDTDVDELEALLEPYGQPRNIKLVKGLAANGPTTYALVETDNYSAETTIACLNGTPFKGRLLYIDEAIAANG